MIRTSLISVWKNSPVVLPAVAVATMALVAGWAVGWGGWLIAVTLIAILAFGALVSRGPFTVLLIWMALSPFTQGRVLDLGAGIPDPSVDRVLLMLAATLVLVQVVTRTRSLRRIEAEEVCLLVFLGWGVVSVLFWRPLQRTTQLRQLFEEFFLPVMMYWIVLQVVTSEQQMDRLLSVALIALIVLSLPTLLEELTGVTLLGEVSQSRAGVVRVQSFTRAPWELGAVAGMLLALASPTLSLRGKSMRKWFGVLAVLVGSVAIFLTFIRTSWLAAIVVFLLIGTFTLRLRRWVYSVLVVATVVIFGSWFTISGTEVWRLRITNFENIVRRQLVFRQQLKMFAQSPFLGHGLQAEPLLFYTFGGFESISHNMYMSLLIDFGLLGLFYLLAIALILKKSVSTYQRLPSGSLIGKELVVALWAAAAVFFIHALTLETRLFSSINTLFWMSMALLKALRNIKGHERIVRA